MGWYEAVGRRMFFSMDPERSHRLALRLLGLPLPWPRIGGAVDDPALTTTLAGIPLRNPVGLAAGFDKTCTHLDALGSLGFGYVVGGTVTRTSRRGNPRPRIARDPGRRALVNAMGMPNPFDGNRAFRSPLGVTYDQPSRVSKQDWRVAAVYYFGKVTPSQQKPTVATSP